LAGQYTMYVRDEDDCQVQDTVTITGSPEVTITSVETTAAFCSAANGEAIVRAQGGTGNLRFQIEDIQQTDSVFLELRSGVNTLLVTDENGCQVASEVLIPEADCPIYFPNAFTPNEDGLNDLFQIKFHPDFNGKISLFRLNDRWGNFLLEVRNVEAEDFGWDGSISGEEMPSGGYIYLFEVEYDNGQKELHRGEVFIIR